jgi:hypothetical protein
MDITRLVPDFPLVLTDWFGTPEYTGYSTFHVSLGAGSETGVCGREGLPYAYYSALLSPEDEMICSACVATVRELHSDGMGVDYENGYGVEDL